MPRSFAEIGDAVYAQLNDLDKARLARAMLRAARSGEGSQDDDWYCALANMGYSVSNWEGEPATEEDMRMMCAIMVEAWSSPRAQTIELERGRILRGAFGYDDKDRFEAMYATAALPSPSEIGDAVFAQLTTEEKERLAGAMAAASESGWGDGTDTLYGDLGDAGLAVPVRRGEPITDENLRRMCAVLEKARRFPRTGDGDWLSLLGYCFGYATRKRFAELYAAAGGTG